MLEAAIEEKAAAAESIVAEASQVRKENRSLEKKLSKLQVKRTKRGSSREALEYLQEQIRVQQDRNANMLDGFRSRLASKQARVQACRFVLSEIWSACKHLRQRSPGRLCLARNSMRDGACLLQGRSRFIQTNDKHPARIKTTIV